MKDSLESIGRRRFLLSAAAGGAVLTALPICYSTSLETSLSRQVQDPDTPSGEAVELLWDLTRRYGAEFGALGKDDS